MTIAQEYKTITFSVDNEEGFFVDVTIIDDKYMEAWLSHKEYGIKEMMMGTDCNLDDIDYFLNLIDDEIEYYIKLYKEEHMETN